MAALATETGIHIADVSRMLPLAFLSPKLADAILTRSPACRVDRTATAESGRSSGGLERATPRDQRHRTDIGRSDRDIDAILKQQIGKLLGTGLARQRRSSENRRKWPARAFSV